MSIRALIIDDDPEIVRTVGDILSSLEHEYDSAGDIEGAKKLLKPDVFQYVILDMDLPVAPGRLSRKENGRNFLAQIRQTPGTEMLPVIVITGRDENDIDFAVSVLKNGNGGWTDYVRKPIHGDKLDKAIRDALGTRAERAKAAKKEAVTAELTPFNATVRELVIHEDHITICGVEVWRDCAQPDVRDALAQLSPKNKHGYVRIRGTKLNELLKRDASNPISKPLERFCKRAIEVLETEKALKCDRYDILDSKKGGYHFTRWMNVRLIGSWAKALGLISHEPVNEPVNEPTNEPDEPQNEPSEPVLNDRQQWVLSQVDKGIAIKLKDVLFHFRTKYNRSTINRDLKGLREMSLIQTNEDEIYVRIKPAGGPSRKP